MTQEPESRSYSSKDLWDALGATWREPADPVIDNPVTGAPAAGTVSVADPSAIALRVARLGRRQRRLTRLLIAVELGVVLVFGGASLLWIAAGPIHLRVAGLFILPLLLVVAWLRRGSWLDRRPLPAVPPTELVELLLERNRSAYGALTFAKVLALVETLFFVVWIPWAAGWPSLGDLLFEALWLAAILIILAMVLRFSRLHLDRERSRLDALRRELDG